MNIRKWLRPFAFLIPVLALVIVPIAYAGFVGTSLWTSFAAYNWATDSSWTADPSGLMRLNPYESASDTTGKTYHYVIGAASGGEEIITSPVDVQGYDHLGIQLFNTRADVEDVVVSAAFDGELAVKGTIYPANLSSARGFVEIPLGTMSLYSRSDALISMATTGFFRYDLDGVASRIILVATPGVVDITHHILVRVD